MSDNLNSSANVNGGAGLQPQVKEESQDSRSQIVQLIALAKSQGYLTHREINDSLLNAIVDPDQLEELYLRLKEGGIEVLETAPDTDMLQMLSLIHI